MILLNLIYIFNLILLLYFIKILFISYFYKSIDIIQYKIINKYLSAIIIIGYISLILIGSYIYRIFRIGHTLDLKLLLINYYTFKNLDISIIHKIYFVLHGILIILLFMLLILNIHKYASLEIFKVYIFINYKRFLDDNKYTKSLHEYLRWVGPENILNYFITSIACNITWFLRDLEISHGAKYKEFEMPKYKFYEILHNITTHRFLGVKHIYTFDVFLYYVVPIILIIYDCLFHNYELTFIFYYLPIIIPIILFQKVTKTIANTDGIIRDLMWEIYYKEEDCIYACTEKEVILINTYLLTGLQMLPGLDMVFLNEHLSSLNNSPLHFKLVNAKHNMYQNDFGDCAQKLPHGDFVLVTDYLFDDDIKKYGSDEKPFITYGEKLILLIEKK